MKTSTVRILEWTALIVRSFFALGIIWYFSGEIRQYGFSWIWILKAVCGVFLCIAMPMLLVISRLRGREVFEPKTIPQKIIFASIWVIALLGLVAL